MNHPGSEGLFLSCNSTAANADCKTISASGSWTAISDINFNSTSIFSSLYFFHGRHEARGVPVLHWGASLGINVPQFPIASADENLIGNPA